MKFKVIPEKEEDKEAAKIAEKILDWHYKQCAKYNLPRKYIEVRQNANRRKTTTKGS